jgi:hypothetical protein
MILSGNNYANYADEIFSNILQTDRYNKIPVNKTYVVKKESNRFAEYVWYLNKELTINQSGSLIFTHFDTVGLLKKILRKNNIRNCSVIVHLSDKNMSYIKYIFYKNFFKFIYSTNVTYSSDNLFSLPIGISNEYIKNNLSEKNFLDRDLQGEKFEKIYLNFNENTNFFHRSWIQKNLENKNFVHIEKSKLSKKQYLNDIKNYKFVLCPWGNGYDTHRIWEALYAGSIPVVKYHRAFESFKHLPIIFYTNIKELTLDYLNDELTNKKELEINDLELSNWISKNNLDKKYIKLNVDIRIVERYFHRLFLIKKINSKYKILRSYLYRILKKIIFSNPLI